MVSFFFDCALVDLKAHASRDRPDKSEGARVSYEAIAQAGHYLLATRKISVQMRCKQQHSCEITREYSIKYLTNTRSVYCSVLGIRALETVVQEEMNRRSSASRK